MAIKKLFLCHPREAAGEVHRLADALRLRGIVPWLDQQGGFSLGDLHVDEARRVLREECFGLLLYATADAFELDLGTKVGYWATDCPPSSVLAVRADLRGGSAASERLHVELSTLDQPVQDAVRRYIQRTGQSPAATLRLTAEPATYGGVMGNAEACAIADQVRREIAQVAARQLVAEIHLYAAVPQALATMIGRRFNALSPVQLYEYDGREYRPSCLLRP